MDSDEEDNFRPPSSPAEALPLVESQYRPHPEADKSFPQLCAGDAHSRFLAPETKPLETRDSGDVVAGDNSCALDVTDLPGGGCGDVSQSPRLLLSVAEEDLDESARTEEGGDIEPLEIPREVPGKNEKDGNLLPREGAREAGENSDLTFNNDNNMEPDVDNDVEGKDEDMNTGVEFPRLNEGTETEVVVDEGAENSVMATEQGVASIIDKPAMAYEDKESIGKMGLEEELKEEPTDVADGLGQVKEENENEAEIEEKKVDTFAESMMLEAESVVPTEMSEMAEETEAAVEAFNETGQMDEVKAKDSMDEGETDVANAVDEIQVTEAEEMEEVRNAEVEGDVAEEMDEGDNVEEIGEGDTGEEIGEGDTGEEIQIVDGTKVAAANEVEEVSRNVGGKRKRRKNAKTPVRTPSKKKAEEDVCFICFDGGELVLCDRRGCPKAYHPTCVNRDDAFFRSRGRWNCGWHICSNCEKNAYYMCYTCTFSLCKGCIKDAVILCVRGNKGFCESCMKTVLLIERNEQENKETAQVDFDDRSSFEYLFKDYWVELKGKLSLTFDELSRAKNPWKGSELSAGKRESRDELYDAQNDGGSGSDDSSGNPEVNPSKRKKAKKRLKSHSKERGSKITKYLKGGQEALTDESTEWASKELLQFVMHMKNGDKSVCSQFDVQALLLEYIKRNKLRDPHRKSQIICDSRLEKLFGKSLVGHFEMLKLLESHFLLKEDSQADDMQGSVVDTEANHSEVDGSDVLVKGSKDRKRRSWTKNDGRGLQSNLDDYAAIDTNNINLIYLRRSLVENLLDDTETFHDKVVGAFVRIRISGSAQKQDLYRLVQVVGTNKATEPYKVGKKTTEFVLEILNLNKTEIASIDIISNQDFTEDECKRLRQSIRCGLINRLTVGDIQEKAMALQAVRVEDSLETEITRLSHLRDRASDMGRRKELRECVEKLQLLKSPAERQRRLEEIPEVHTDPNMDPSYESEEDDGMEDRKQDNSLRSGGSNFNRKGRDPTPGSGSFSTTDSWSGTRSYPSTNRELGRSFSNKSFSIKGDDVPGGGVMLNEELWGQGGDRETQQSRRPKPVSNLDNRSVHSSLPSESIPSVKQDFAVRSSSKTVVASTTKINETEKIWHYKDPSGKIQGPFSMVQLRKWSVTGYFPADLKIWRATEKQDDSILLTDALAGNFRREPQVVDSSLLNSQHFEKTNSTGWTSPAPLKVSKFATDKWDSETNLPSSTPAQAASSGAKCQPHEIRWSPTPVQSAASYLGTSPLVVGNGDLRHTASVMPRSGQLTHSPISSSLKISSSANSPHMLSQSTLPSESPRGQTASHLLLTPDSSGASVNVAQNLVRPVAVTNLLVGTQKGPENVLGSKPEMVVVHAIHGSGSQVWGSVPSQKVEQNNSISGPEQSSAYGCWGDVPSSIHNSASSITAGNPNSASSAPPSDLWRGAITGQPSIQPSASSNAPGGVSATDNQTTGPRRRPENQSSGWGPVLGNTNMGWGGSVPTNSNQRWIASSQQGAGAAPGNANPGWIAHGQGHAPRNANTGWAGCAQGQAPGNASTGWVLPAQGPGPVNQGWVASGEGPPQGNGNSSWAATKGNMGSRGNEKSGDRFSSGRDGGSEGGHLGNGADKPWNRQQSHSRGDSSRPYKGHRVCKYHESGHCKKGAACDYLHS